MLTFVGSVLRFLIGFILACLAAGFVQVLFAVTPTELVAAGEERWGEAGTWGLLSATQIAVFAAPFALIAALVSEWQGIRSFAYHAIVAMAIAVAGFGLIHMNESPAEASIVNSYAMAAYLTSGFVGGLVYWLFAGRSARRMAISKVRMETDRPIKESRKPSAEDGRRVHRSTGTVPATKPPPGSDEAEDKLSGVPKSGESNSA